MSDEQQNSSSNGPVGFIWSLFASWKMSAALFGLLLLLALISLLVPQGVSKNELVLLFGPEFGRSFYNWGLTDLPHTAGLRLIVVLGFFNLLALAARRFFERRQSGTPFLYYEGTGTTKRLTSVAPAGEWSSRLKEVLTFGAFTRRGDDQLFIGSNSYGLGAMLLALGLVAGLIAGFASSGAESGKLMLISGEESQKALRYEILRGGVPVPANFSRGIRCDTPSTKPPHLVNCSLGHGTKLKKFSISLTRSVTLDGSTYSLQRIEPVQINTRFLIEVKTTGAEPIVKAIRFREPFRVGTQRWVVTNYKPNVEGLGPVLALAPTRKSVRRVQWSEQIHLYPGRPSVKAVKGDVSFRLLPRYRLRMQVVGSPHLTLAFLALVTLLLGGVVLLLSPPWGVVVKRNADGVEIHVAAATGSDKEKSLLAQVERALRKGGK